MDRARSFMVTVILRISSKHLPSVEEILEYLNSDRIEDMTEEMHECSRRQSQAAIKQTMELNTKYHTPEEIVRIMSELTCGAISGVFEADILIEYRSRKMVKY